MARLKRYRPVSIEGIEFDALLSEERTYNATIPSYPVEDGSSVSDTIILDPEERSFSLYIAANPITYYYRHGNSRSRVQQICKELEELWFKKKLVKITTPDEILTDMGITSLSISRSKETGYSREVSLSVKKIRITEKQTAAIPAEIAQSGATAANAGSATTSTSSGRSAESGSSAMVGDGTGAADTATRRAESQEAAQKITHTSGLKKGAQVLSTVWNSI